MDWYTGPLIWDTSRPSMPFWRAPDVCTGMLDPRPLAAQGQAGGTPGIAVFVAPTGSALPSEYELIGRGAHRDIKVTQRLRDMLPVKRGFKPQGDDLLGLLLSLFTVGADPTGDEFARPIMPGTDGRLALHVGGQSHYERFRWGQSPETAGLKTLLRLEFAALMDAAEAGKLKDREHHRRVLDALCEKYAVDDWKEFVDPKRQKDIPGRLKHETSYSDDFNRADESLDASANWAEVVSNWSVASNKASIVTGSAVAYARREQDLSSSDNYTDATANSSANDFNYMGAVCRMNASDSNCYFHELAVSENTSRVYKRVSGTNTSLNSVAFTVDHATNYVSRCKANGSTIDTFVDTVSKNSVTDTAVASGVRGGLWGFRLSGTVTLDDFLTSDISGAGILYTQLESNTRGVHRGVYTRY